MSAWFWLWLFQVGLATAGVIWALWQSVTLERLERERDELWDEVHGVSRLPLPRYVDGRDGICNLRRHPCGCVTVFDLATWHSNFDSQCTRHRAEAWDQGFQAACDETPMDATPDGPTDTQNPYRTEDPS